MAVEMDEVVRVAGLLPCGSISSIRATVGGRQKSTRTLGPSGSRASKTPSS